MGKHKSGSAWGEADGDEEDESVCSLNSILALGETPSLRAILDDFWARKRAWPQVKAAIMADRDRRDLAIADGTWEPPNTAKPKPTFVMPTFWRKKTKQTGR